MLLLRPYYKNYICCCFDQYFFVALSCFLLVHWLDSWFLLILFIYTVAPITLFVFPNFSKPYDSDAEKRRKFSTQIEYCIYILQCCPDDRTPLKCKDKIPKFRNKYSQKRNIGVSVPISTFRGLWAIYIFPPSVCLFCWRKYVDQSWDYINCSQSHECWNWGWGRAIPRKGIHKWNFRCSV